MIGNCKDCRWWEENRDMAGNKWMTCAAVDTNYSDGAAQWNVAFVYAYARDDSGLMAELRTGPMFGCILFEENDEDD